MNMKKRILIILFILILICISTFAIYVRVKPPIEVEEISMLYEEFSIESERLAVVLGDKDVENVNSEIAETSSNVVKSTNGKSSSSTKNNTKTSAAGVGSVTYTPKIQIPRTGIKYTIFSNMTTKNMEKGVVILYTENGLNQPGNTVISGHNYGNGRLFSKNDRIQVGDLIYITDSTGQKLKYSVYSKYLTNPNDANYMERDTNGTKEISLTTCTLDNKNRIIILARET